jgi:hypothetical protein
MRILLSSKKFSKRKNNVTKSTKNTAICATGSKNPLASYENKLKTVKTSKTLKMKCLLCSCMSMGTLKFSTKINKKSSVSFMSTLSTMGRTRRLMKKGMRKLWIGKTMRGRIMLRMMRMPPIMRKNMTIRGMRKVRKRSIEERKKNYEMPNKK